jgi:hypothetical protein
MPMRALVGGPEDAERLGKAVESVVEYDIHVPVAGDYILKAKYASPEARPVEAFMNGRYLGRGFDHATFGTAPGELPVLWRDIARPRPQVLIDGCGCIPFHIAMRRRCAVPSSETITNIHQGESTWSQT